MQLMKLDIANGEGQKNRLVFRQEKMIESRLKVGSVQVRCTLPRGGKQSHR